MKEGFIGVIFGLTSEKSEYPCNSVGSAPDGELLESSTHCFFGGGSFGSFEFGLAVLGEEIFKLVTSTR